MVLCVIGLATFAGWAEAVQEAVPTPSQPLVITTGEGIIRVAPGRAYVTVVAESRASNPREAQRQNAEAMTAVQQTLQRARVPKDAIRTVGYTLEPVFDYVNGRQVPRGYVVRNTIDVRVDDLERVGDILDLVVSSGATSVSSVRVDLKNRETLERDALTQAVADARARAEAAAAGAGRAIDRVLRIEETRSLEITRPQPRFAAAEAASTPIAPGDLEVRAHVTLTAVLK